MVEGFSAPPPDEVPKLPSTELLPRRKGLKGFLESFRYLSNKEKDDDDEEGELSPRQSRMGKLFRKIFGGIVGKEDIAQDQPERSSLFFGVGEVGEETPVAPPAAEAPESRREAVDDESVPEEISVEEASFTPDEVSAEAEAKPATPDAESTVVEDTAVEIAAEPDVTPVEERTVPVETAFVYGAYDRHRVRNMERREHDLESKIKKLDKDTEHQKEVIKELKQEAKARPPEKAPERPRTVEAVVPNVEAMRRVERRLTPEIKRSVVEKAVEKHSKELSREKKQEVIEKILIAPEFKGAVNIEEQKEIAYEMSHEHKDLDAQSQSSWAALQAAADATAKANAKALAEAEELISTAESGDALKLAVAQQAQDQKTLYKKAAVSGFVTAVVLVAVLLIILLIQRS